MTQDKSRAAFEAWHISKGLNVPSAKNGSLCWDIWQASEQRIMDELGSEEIKKLVGAAICKAFQDNEVLWIEPAAKAAITAITTKLKGE